VIRSPVQYFQNAYGLFSDVWAPFTEIILNLIVSIIFGKLFGIAGIMLGTFSSLAVIVLLWKPYFLYKRGFETNIWEYWKGFLLLSFVLIVSSTLIHFIASNYLTINVSSFLGWSFSAVKISGLIIIIYGSLLYLFSVGFRNICLRFKALIFSKIGMK
ncbi:MAG: sugar transporter, partial [Bacteroidota bacterium]